MTCDHPKSRNAKMCRACNLKAMWADPEFRARKAAANAQTLRKLRTDPAFVERERARQSRAVRIMNASPRKTDPNVIARRGRTFSERRMAWCPPHLRDEYFRLMKNKHLPALEARKVIEAHIRDEARRNIRAIEREQHERQRREIAQAY